MFSAFRKLGVQLLGALHDVIDSNSDAGRTARHGVRQITKQIQRAEESVTDVAAQKRLAESDRDKAGEDASKWGRLARKSADAGDRAAAVDAVHHQVIAEEEAAAHAAQVEHLAPQLQQLQARLSELRKAKRDKEHRASLLTARSKVADAELRAARVLGNVGAATGVDFEQLDKDVSRKEAKAAAVVELAEQKLADEPDARLAQLSRRTSIDAKLRDLGLQGVAAATHALAEGGAHA